MRRKLASLLFLLLFVVYNLNAQKEHFLSSHTINSNTISEDHYSKKILTSIAHANNKDIRATQIKLNFEFKKQIEITPNNNIEVFISLENFSLAENIYYRNFTIDSLLIPDYGLAKVNVSYDGKNIFNQTIEIPLKGKKLNINTETQIINRKQLKVEIELFEFEYSRSKFERFVKTSNLINNYYGFSLLLNELNKKSKEISSKNTLVSSAVFLQWHETARINGLLKKLDLTNTLNLKSNDPENLVRKTKDLERHARRATTLLNQCINAELNKGFIADKQKYLNGLCNLSETYYEKSKSYQPFISASFLEAINFNKYAGEIAMIGRISKYYDSFAYGDQVIIPVSLYNMFVESARKYLDRSKNNMALQQLNNAKAIQQYFELPESKFYSATLAITLNGIIESFLKVSNMAFKSGNFKMAEHYYLDAEKVFSENENIFHETNIASTPFTLYISTQKEIAYELVASHKYEAAEKTLEHCLKISSEKNLPKDDEIFSLLDKMRNGVYNNILKQAKRSLEHNNPNEALKILYRAEQYSETYFQINKSKFFDEIAYSIFLEFMQKGEILLDNGKHDEAIENLLTAKTIQSNLLDFEIDRLDYLLKANSIPVILDMVEEASFQTWAMRTDEANKLLYDAKTMQVVYHQEDNSELNTALQSLEDKMSSRHCMDIAFSLKENAKLILKKINSGNFEKANQIYLDSYQITIDNNDCNLDFSEIENIKEEYHFIFSFNEEYQLMKNKLFGEGYEEAIEIYLKLRNTYFTQNIKSYNFELPSLHEFVEQQNLTRLTYSSVSYFIKKQQFQLAFEYLQLLKSQGFSMSESKNLQIELGTAFAESFNGNKEECQLMAEELSQEDKWFKYFNKSMGN